MLLLCKNFPEIMTERRTQFFEIKNLIRDIFRVFMERINERMGDEVKLTHEQFAVLFHISEMDDEVTQQEMAERMKKDKSVILRMVDVLEEKNLVRRVTDPNDRRKNCLMLTKSGTRLIEGYKAIGLEIIDQIHEGIDGNDLDTFYRVIGQLRTNTNHI